MDHGFWQHVLNQEIASNSGKYNRNPVSNVQGFLNLWFFSIIARDFD